MIESVDDKNYFYVFSIIVENVNDLSVHNNTVSVWRKMPQNEKKTKITTETKKN
ncbi:MAG: hypothetical protein ACEY3C_04630 [Candidatus Tisiphia sp.]